MEIKKYFYLLLGVMILMGCAKRPETLEEYLPQLELISAEITPFGKIEVHARILSEGPRGLYYVGFCADSVANPAIDANQVLTYTLYGDEFVAVLGDNFFPGTYSHLYINAFATNDFAYNTAIPIFIDSTSGVGVRPDIDIPCELEINEVRLNQSGNSLTYSNIGAVETTNGKSTFYATVNSSTKVKFTFIELDQNIYTSAMSNQDLDGDKMLVAVIQNGIENPISPGMNIYVAQVENTTFDIVICGANWGFNSVFKTRVRVSV